MKKISTLLCIVALLNSNAQTTVTIPDANFVTYLQSIIPAAMSGDQMDTTNTLVTTNTHRINVSSLAIANLFGIHYFSSLTYLNCRNDSLTTLTALPNSIDTLICDTNKLTRITAFPTSLTYLTCRANALDSLPHLPNLIAYIDSRQNPFTVPFPALPNSLIYLDCSQDRLDSIPTLPNSLQVLYCNWNNLSNLPTLPATLQAISCFDNNIFSLPALPNSLTYINIADNFVSTLPALPSSLITLHCEGNILTGTFPALPNSLINLYCFYNTITSLPALPGSLQILWCHNNHLTTIPALPASLTSLECSTNHLTTLPSLPNTLQTLECGTNSITCFQPFPISLTTIQIDPNSYTCLPNHIPAMNSVDLAAPLCAPIITIGNNACDSTKLICSPASSYSWSNGATTQSIYVKTSGKDSVIITTDTSLCLATSAIMVTVNPLPTITATTNTATLCLDSTAILSANGAITYIWSIGATTSSISVTPTVTTLYTVAGIDANGCVNTATVTQVVTNCGAAGIVRYLDNDNQVLIYPNPSNGVFSIETNAIEKQTIQFYDVNGKMVLTQFISNKTTIDVSSLNEGLYNLNIISNQGVINKRVIIAR